jgi:hypothetical protein
VRVVTSAAEQFAEKLRFVLGYRFSVWYQGIALAIPKPFEINCPFRGWVLNLEFFSKRLKPHSQQYCYRNAEEALRHPESKQP